MKLCTCTAPLREISALMRAGAFSGEEAIIIADDDEMNAVHGHADNLALVERIEMTGTAPAFRRS